MSSEESSTSYSELVEVNLNQDTQQNLVDIKCALCPSIVLRKGTAQILRKPKSLPAMHSKSEQGDFPLEALDEYWVVDNMYTFENVGFSNAIGTTKYLVCADCEQGPIGYHDTDCTTEFLIAAKRVAYN